MGLTIRSAAALAAGAAALAGCATPEMPQKGAFVPFSEVMAETSGKPWECTAYEAATDSCEALSTYELTGDRIDSRGQFVIDTRPSIIAAGAVRFRERDGRACGNLGQMRMSFDGLDDPQAETFIREAVRATFGQMGEICVSYFRAGEDRYVVEARDAAGALIPDGTDVVTFFADKKALREADL
ncbi:hypothetical protein [Litorisediminicola beolgyonensis]|uniref:Lipoprotein n=1 Tax=Litorisediminicola beolgyonensis TaxID=1173614 RepID=A0ABW3ZN07_9RHOB